jgi:prepilin signal peptidase PulO-like enzyme (type II secretory pathway)
MSPSKRIAGLVGPPLIALTVSERVNLGIWKTNDPRVTYLNGLLLFIGGLAIVHAHNVWVYRWPVLLTLVGWLAMAAGLFRMFAPKAPQGGENPLTYAVIAAICAVGVVLTIQAYRPSG